MAISKITGSALGKDVIMKDVATADGSSPTLTLQTGDTDIAADDVLGTINFQAPDEGAGTDAILVAAGISAVSEGDFSSSSNATKLVFKTGASEAATEKMSLSSAGNLTITTADNSDQLTLKSTDADANSGPSLVLSRDSGSPADNDAGGKISFNFDEYGGGVSRTAAIFTTLVDASAGSEDGKIHIETMVAGAEGERFGISPTEVVVNEASIDLDFRVESDGDANALVVDAGSNRVGFFAGSDIATGNQAKVNIGGVNTNIANQSLYVNGTKTSFASSSYYLWQGQTCFGDDTAQDIGVGGAIVFAGTTTDSDVTQVHAATIEAYKENNNSTEYGFQMVGRTRANGNATMQVGFIFHPTNVQFWTSNTRRFDIASNGDLTATDTSIGSLSDERLKENVADYDYPLDTFKKFSVKSFDWKEPTEHGDRTNQKGLIAQEVEKIDSTYIYEYALDADSKDGQYVPTVTESWKYTDDEDGKEKTQTKDVKYAKSSKLGEKDAMYISVIQQLMEKIETLETKVKALEEA